MAGGAVVAQGIPILLAPLFTRIYSAQEYGAFSAFVALSGMLSIVYGMRLDLAVMLPKYDGVAIRVVRAALVTVFIWFVVSLFFLIFVTLLFPGVSIFSALKGYIFLLPLAAALLAVFNMGNVWVGRKGKFGVAALGGVAQQSTFGMFALVLPFISSLNGLIVGRLVGSGVASWYFFRNAGLDVGLLFKRSSIKRVYFLYRQFPFFNLPYSLISSFTRDLLVILLSAFHMMDAAGLLGLSRNLLNAPVYLISRALGQVFYREAARKFGTEGLEHLFFKILFLMSRGTIPFVVLFIFWAEPLFSLIFGKEWSEAGQFSAILAPSIYLFFFTSWPERLYEVARKQHVSFGIQLSFDLLNVLMVTVLLTQKAGLNRTVTVYAVILALQQLVYLVTVAHISGFSIGRTIRWILETTVLATFWYFVVVTTKAWLVPGIKVVLVLVICAAIWAAAVLVSASSNMQKAES